MSPAATDFIKGTGRDLVLLAVGAAAVLWGVWWLTKKTVAGAQAALDTAQRGTTDAIEHFFPLVDQRSMITHAVRFPEDGKLHAVPGESVDAFGYFTRDGKRYRLLTDAAGNKVAQARFTG